MIKPEDLKAITDLLKNDPEVVERIDSFLDEILPDSWGWAGNIRNIGFMASLRDPSELETYSKVCTGIAKITSEKIQEEIGKGNPAFSHLKSSTFIDRNTSWPIIGRVAHTATSVTTKDGETFVLDYHHTLNQENPMIYPSVKDWENETNGQTAKDYFKNNPLPASQTEMQNNEDLKAIDFSGLLGKLNEHISSLQSNIS
jgi:hypothetical protein